MLLFSDRLISSLCVCVFVSWGRGCVSCCAVNEINRGQR